MKTGGSSRNEQGRQPNKANYTECNDLKIIGRMILMLNIKHTLMVSTLSLGLVMGGVAVVSAATSATDTPQTAPTHVTTARITPVATTPAVVIPAAATPAVVTPAAVPKTHVTPVAVPKTHVTTVPVKAIQNNYHYSDGHSNMNPEQHQQMHVTQPSENHHSGSESGHDSGHE